MSCSPTTLAQALLLVCFLSCQGSATTKGPSDPAEYRAALSAARTDTARQRLLVEFATLIKTERPDTAMLMVLQAEAMAERVGRTEAGKDAEELHGELLTQEFDPAAAQYLTGLIIKNRDLGDRKRELNAHMLLASQQARTSQFLVADSLLRVLIVGAEEIGARVLQCQAHGLGINVSNALGRLDEALLHADRGLGLYDTTMPVELRPILIGDRSATHFYLGHMDSAIADVSRAGDLHFANGDTVYALMARGMQAAYLLEAGNYTKVVDILLRSEQLRDRIDNPQSAAVDAYNLGDAYRRLDQPEEALKRLSEARSIASRIGMVDLAAMAQSAQAVLWSTMDPAALHRIGLREGTVLDSAMAVFIATEQVLAQSGRFQEYGILQIAIGRLLMRQGQRGDAYFEKAYSTYEAAGMTLGMCEALLAMADAALAQGEFGKALRLQEQGLALSRASGWKDIQARLLEGKSSAHAGMGRADLALNELLRSKKLVEEHRGDSATRAVADLKAGFAYSRKQLVDSLEHAQEIQLERQVAHSAVSLQRTRIKGLIIGGSLLFGGAAGAYWLDRRRRKERYAKQVALLETKALRAQMNPHFLFNALNSISAFIRDQQPSKAHDFVARFARLMRLVLENSRKTEVPLRRDLEALRIYLELEQVRSGDRFDFAIHVDQALDQEEMMVPPMVVQPFVENSIWHGFDGKVGRGMIELRVTRKTTSLLMTICDDGIGRAVREAQSGTSGKVSLGTHITHERLQLLQEIKGGPAGFRYVDVPTGTCVEVELPI